MDVEAKDEGVLLMLLSLLLSMFLLRADPEEVLGQLERASDLWQVKWQEEGVE